METEVNVRGCDQFTLCFEETGTHFIYAITLFVLITFE